MSANGYNPMRWRCEDRGCFNVKKRPKIEKFCDCFPGRISLSDIDGVVEINGRFLLLEWKEDPKEIPTGQRIMFGWLTAAPNRQFTVLCVAGDAETMLITHAMHYTGPSSEWRPRDFDWCWRFMSRWSDWAAKQQKLMKMAA